MMQFRKNTFLNGFFQYIRDYLLIIMTLLSACTPLISQDVHEELMREPVPFPDWLMAVGPPPSHELPVDKAWYGEPESPDPFWPGFGPICIQIDGHRLGMDFKGLSDRVKLVLNGRTLHESRILGLLYGYERMNGMILRSEAREAQLNNSFNVCWAIDLGPGDYLAKVIVINSVDVAQTYTWAFRLY